MEGNSTSFHGLLATASPHLATCPCPFCHATPLAYNRHLHLRRSIVQIPMLHYSIQLKITKDMDVTKHLNFLPSAITFTKERSSQSFVKVMGCWLNIITKQQCICKTYNVIQNMQLSCNRLLVYIYIYIYIYIYDTNIGYQCMNRSNQRVHIVLHCTKYHCQTDLNHVQTTSLKICQQRLPPHGM